MNYRKDCDTYPDHISQDYDDCMMTLFMMNQIPEIPEEADFEDDWDEDFDQSEVERHSSAV